MSDHLFLPRPPAVSASGDAADFSAFEPMRDHAKSSSNSYAHLGVQQQPFYRARRMEEQEQEMERQDDDNAATSSGLQAAAAADDDLVTVQPFQLHVTNIPPDLDKFGVRNLFAKHGRVVDVYVHRLPARSSNDRLWGKVTFASHMEAQSAIAALHRTPPWHLAVRYAMTLEQQQQHLLASKQDRSNDDEQQEARTTPPVVPEGRGKMLQDLARSKAAAMAPVGEVSNSGCNGKSSRDDAAGRGGRGGPVGPLVSTRLHVERLPPKEFGYPVLLPYTSPGLCRHCQIAGTLLCSRCKVWYCSQDCQIKDWPDHRPNCQSPPPLDHPDGTPFRNLNETLRRPFSPTTTQRVQADVDKQQAEVQQKVAVEKCPPVLEMQSDNRQQQHQDLRQTVTCPVPDEPSPPFDLNAQPDKQQVSPHPVPEKPPTTAVPAPASSGWSCFESVLVSAVPNSRVDFYCALKEKSFVVDSFCAMLMEEEAGTYLLAEMQDEMAGRKPLSEVSPADLVAYIDAEAMYVRGFVLEVSGKDAVVTLLNIDTGVIDVCAPSKVFPLAEKAKSYPAMAVRFRSEEKTTSEVARILRGNFKTGNGMFALEFKEVVPRHGGRDGRYDARGSVLGKNQDRMVKYLLRDWRAIDPRVSKLLGVLHPKVYVSDLNKYHIANGDRVFRLDCEETTDLVVVQSVNGVDSLGELEQVMGAELARETIPVSDPQIGELVACPWGEEGEDSPYFRAEILQINPEGTKVRVRFVDYGNYGDEFVEKLVRIPECALSDKFPMFARIYKLSNVSSEPSSLPEVKLKMDDLKPHLDVDFRIIFEDERADPKVVQIEHPKGMTLNEMMRQKLAEPMALQKVAITGSAAEAARPGDLQGKIIGIGGSSSFAYDKCHVTEIAHKPDTEQIVLLLYFEDPLKIFVTTMDQASVGAALNNEIFQHVAAVKATIPDGYGPAVGNLCLAKASDEQWYRGACLEVTEYEGVQGSLIFFPDYGYQEFVSRKYMLPITEELVKFAPFMANRCVLLGCSTAVEDKEQLIRAYGVLQRRLLAFEEISIVTVERKEAGNFVIRIPCVEKELEAMAEEARVKARMEAEKKEKMRKREELARLMAELDAEL